jgi:guanine deaminase
MPDAVMVIEAGKITAVGPYADLRQVFDEAEHRFDYQGQWLMPGFVDSHIHYVQTDVIASPSVSLLQWLDTYVYESESRFADPSHAESVANVFLRFLLQNGTTSAGVFASVHRHSCDAIFKAAQAMGMRINAGKVLMDQHAPANILDTAQGGIDDSLALIERWHGRSRLRYSVTPRFVATSSAKQLRWAGGLYQSRPDLHVQSHVAENEEEVAWVKRLYPSARSYLQVYDDFGLLGPRTTYAHGVWLDDVDRELMARRKAALAFCPTSNLFLGSGLFDLAATQAKTVRVGLATDVGGGDSFSMLSTMREAYKVCQLKRQPVSVDTLFYMATSGAAHALGLEAYVGDFSVGKEADFVVYNLEATPLLARRMSHCQSLSEQLFVMLMLGDDRAIARVHLMGKPVK